MAMNLVCILIRIFVKACRNHIRIFELAHPVNHLIRPDKSQIFRKAVQASVSCEHALAIELVINAWLQFLV